jgi:chemotaxis-related protein WspB
MLFVLFQLGSDRYALEAALVVEVLPLVALKELPQAPVGVAGLVNYRGAAVPVIDLTALALGPPAVARVSTRLLIVRYAPAQGGEHLLGLVAERATETLRRAPEDFQPTNVDSAALRWLGPVVRDRSGLIQRVDPAAMLTDELRAALFPVATEAGR